MMFVDDDSDGYASEHIVWNELLELFAHFTVAPLLAHCLDDPIGIEVAITCHFAMGVCTMMQEDPPPACQTRYPAGKFKESLMPPLSLTVSPFPRQSIPLPHRRGCTEGEGFGPVSSPGGGSLDEEPAIRKRATHRD